MRDRNSRSGELAVARPLPITPAPSTRVIDTSPPDMAPLYVPAVFANLTDTVAEANKKRKTIDMSKLKKELQRAIENEDYERAAQLRDAIKEAEG